MFNYNNYEIEISKNEKNVFVQILDKQFYKLYSKYYYEHDVLNYNMTLDIFYKVLNTVFIAIVEDDKEKGSIVFIPTSKTIKLKIHHKYYIEFIFDMCLMHDKRYTVGPTELCMKKLEQEINVLTKNYNTLKNTYDELNESHKLIENHMSLTVSNCYCLNILIGGIYIPNYVEIDLRINTQNITIRMHYEKNKLSYKYIDNQNTTLLITGETKMNDAFKLIKAEYLELDNITHNFGYKYLPITLKKLKLTGYTESPYLNESEMPNLETIEIEKSTIKNIYESIKHLKTVKNFVIKQSTGFLESGVLTSQGIKVTMQ